MAMQASTVTFSTTLAGALASVFPGGMGPPV
jgi:hypothetical protein